MEDTRPYLVRHLRSVLAMLLVVGLVILAVVLYLSLTFRVTGTDPSTSSVSTVSPYFRIMFNKPLAKAGSVSFYPQNFPTTHKISGSSITVSFGQGLQEGASYQIKLTGIRSVGGAKLGDQIFSFQAQALDSSQLSKPQQSALEQKQASYNAIQQDGLVKLLPFTGGGNEFTISYNVDYSQTKPRLLIVVSASTQQGQLDALNWIRQVGFDPSKYTITYVSPAGE